MNDHRQQWSHREKVFSAFVSGRLSQFWRQREEHSFHGEAGVLLKYISFTKAQHTRAIFIVNGRSESYLKYPEVAYDLFHCGYDIFIMDHRGQGTSERLLSDPHRGHVEAFTDYVDDAETFCLQHLAPRGYPRLFIIAHSMGGAIAALLLHRLPQFFDAVMFTAPMFGVQLPVPEWMADRILNWTELRPGFREGFALGTGNWHAVPFVLNTVTHSRVRYQRNLALYADNADLQLGGPSAHWVKEAIEAGKMVLDQATEMKLPTLLFQAGQDQLVDNAAQVEFCATRERAGHPVVTGKPIVLEQARHEILFETDPIRTQILLKTTDFFASLT